MAIGPAEPAKFAANTVKVAGINAPNRIKDEYIVLFKDETAQGEVKRILDGINLQFKKRNLTQQDAVKQLSVLRGFSGILTQAQLAKLSNSPMVQSIEANQVVSLAPYTNPTIGIGAQTEGKALAPGAWSIDRSDQVSLPLDQSYSPAATGAGVHAYVIDSGIHTTHVGFEGRASWAYTASNVPGGNGDNNGHGTHLAGNIGSSSYGIAKQVNLHAVKVLDAAGTGTLSGLIEGINYVTNNHQKPAVATIGFNTPMSQALNDAVNAAIAAGVTFTVPVGDESRDACNYSPSSVSQSIRVASTWSDDRASVYSNKGSCVDIYAPGLYVKSVWHSSDSANNSISHSPVSAAHVAGAAALVLGQNSNCSPPQVKSQVLSHAANGVLSEVPEGSPNALLNVPTQLSAYINCPANEPVKVYYDSRAFEQYAKAELIHDWNDGVTFDQAINEAKAAGIVRQSHDFVIDSVTGATTFERFLGLSFELGTHVFGFDVNQVSEPLTAHLMFSDFTEETRVINSSGFYGFETEKAIMGIEFTTDGNAVLGNFYRDNSPDGVEVFSTTYQSLFEQQFTTQNYPDLDQEIALYTISYRLSGTQLDLVANQMPVLVKDVDGIQGNDDGVIGSKFATTYSSGNHDFTVEFKQQSPSSISFNTHLSDTGPGFVTFFMTNGSQYTFAIGQHFNLAGFFAIASDYPISSMRFQAYGNSKQIVGVSKIASNTATE